MYTPPKYWLGTEESGDALLAAVAQASAAQLRGGVGESLSVDSLLTVRNGVGVVSVSGPLIQGSAGAMALFGVTGYDDIRAAVAIALADPAVGTVMLHVSSGGGQVGGVEDLGSFLKAAGKIKPLTTYADGTMASAAYWLGSYGQHISTNRTSILGSLGVMMLHADRTAQNAQDGVKYTVIRAGDFKALGNSVEPLTEVAKAELQMKADGIESVFMDVVGPNRGMSSADARLKIGGGREFLGKDAVKNGLADALMTYEQALMHSKSLDKTLQTNNNLSKFKGASDMKPLLTAEQTALLAAGATLQDLGFDAGATLTGPDAFGAAADTSGDLTAAQAQATLLATQLSTAIAEKDIATAETVAFRSQFEALSLTVAKLTDIARTATANMLIPFGGSADSVAQMSGDALIAKHAEADALFKAKLVVGGAAFAATSKLAPTSEDAWQMAMVGAGPQARKAALVSRK